MDSLNGRCYLR